MGLPLLVQHSAIGGSPQAQYFSVFPTDLCRGSRSGMGPIVQRAADVAPSSVKAVTCANNKDFPMELPLRGVRTVITCIRIEVVSGVLTAVQGFGKSNSNDFAIGF